ncbi:pyridoxine 5'-phosphate oxidase C-terminal domain-containing protein [Aquiflexum sp.]
MAFLFEWGGYSIKPIRIEFMEFKTTRFHIRKLFERKNDLWLESQIQP